ncbi:MAG: outer membrane protein assembly factor BamD [Pseudomonadota bacterium]
MRLSLAIILLLSLTACGLLSHTDDKPAASTPVEELYATAKGELEGHNYERAVKAYETLQSRYPYGRYAQQAQLDIAYAYYKQKEGESAIAAADRFIKQYPNNAHVDYAYYLKGLINFNEDLGVLGSIVRQDLSERDPNAAREAFESFKELVTRFPNSRYAPDSRLRMQYLINTLARYQIHVASYYLRRGAYVAAANRAREVLTNYARTPATLDALKIMVQAYDALGLKDLRDDAQRVLDMNSDKSAAN